MRDRDVREAVLEMLSNQHLGDANTRIVQEMGVWNGSVRVDIAVINGELTGVELKSNRDNLDRLPFQSEIYSRVFDQVNLVVGDRHLDNVNHVIPEWWSITLASMDGDRVVLASIRKGQKNPSPDPLLVARLLWKEEAQALVLKKGLAKSCGRKTADFLHEMLSKDLPFEVLTYHVRSALKARGDWLGNLMPGDLKVPVNGKANPARKPSRGLRSRVNCVYLAVPPATD